MYRFWKYILKLYYRMMIFSVYSIPKERFHGYHKLGTIAKCQFETNMGHIDFLFKEDRRKRKRNYTQRLVLDSFIVELSVPSHIEVKSAEIRNNVVIVWVVNLIPVSHTALSEVLLETYLKKVTGLLPT